MLGSLGMKHKPQLVQSESSICVPSRKAPVLPNTIEQITVERYRLTAGYLPRLIVRAVKSGKSLLRG